MSCGVKECFGEFCAVSGICLACVIYNDCGYFHAINETKGWINTLRQRADRVKERSEFTPLSKSEMNAISLLEDIIEKLEDNYKIRTESQEGPVT